MSYFSSFVKSFKNKKVLFHRNYLRFQGGHLKVWDYFNHLQRSSAYTPKIYFTKESIFDASNPWANTASLKKWNPASSDILFLAGLDWEAVLNNQSYLNKKNNLPVINLIQGMSHADPSDIKYSFLKERAIRICVSQQVAESIHATRQVNGPIFIIPNALDLTALPEPLEIAAKDIDLLILAIKKPELGTLLYKQLEASFKKIILITELINRNEFLSLLNRSKSCLFLPHFAEGFYLPALEAMALNTFVICPDCTGNRSFCIDHESCLLPEYNEESIINAAKKAAALSYEERNKYISNAKQIVSKHSAQHERRQFLDIMDNIKNLW